MFIKKYFTNISNPISRFLARILDYSLFYSCFILPLFFTSLLDSNIIHFTCIFLIPLFWAPFEALLIHFFATTPGKALFGLSLENENKKKLSLKDSFKRAFSVWFKGMGGNLPILNIILSIKRFNEIRIKGRSNIDSSNNIHVHQKKRRSIRTIFASSFIAFFSLFFVTEYQLKEMMTASNQEFFSTKLFKKGVNLNWSAYKDPEGNFEIDFPGSPEEDFTKLAIPKSKDTLPFYTVNYVLDKEGVEYTLSYTTLPQSWLKWRPSLFLKGALKIISTKLSQGKILKKTCKDFKTYPALEFIIEKKNNRECAGRLILIDNVLYKIDVTYPKEKQQDVEEHLGIFLQSFKPISNAT